MFHLTTIPETLNHITMAHTFKNCERKQILSPVIKLTQKVITLETYWSVALRGSEEKNGRAKSDESDYLLGIEKGAQDENIKGSQ